MLTLNIINEAFLEQLRNDVAHKNRLCSAISMTVEAPLSRGQEKEGEFLPVF